MMERPAPNTLSLADIEKTIRAISGRGHLQGLATPFTFSALNVYEAGGDLRGKTEDYMLKLGFLTRTADGRITPSEDGQTLLDLCRQRGDRPAVWSEEMAAKAARAPRLVA